MNNIDCEIIMDLLPLYADGMVSNDTGEIVESHLKECEECQEIYRQMTGKIDFSFEKKPMKKRKLKRKNILILMKKDPFCYPPSYEKLSGDLTGLYSRRINRQHRIIYEVDEGKNEIHILRMWTHYDKF